MIDINIPSKYESVDDWVESVLKIIKEQKDNPSWKITFLVRDFKPHQYKFYQKLQDEIAKLIPIEADRPTIILKIRGKNRTSSSTEPTSKKADYAYIGGTGPLSDAAALGGIVEEYGNKKSLDTFSADLISCPPPRDKSILRTKHYLLTMNKFISGCDSNYYCLLSNTAHLNINNLIKLLRTKKMNFVVENLVDKIVDEISSKEGWEKTGILTNNSHILVCGTIVAHDKKLYPNKFKKKNINSHLPVDKILLQKLIDLIKSGKVNVRNEEFDGRTPGEELVLFLIGEMEKLKKTDSSITHLLLSCTELPMAFHSQLSKGLIEKYSQQYPEQSIRTYQDLFQLKCKEKFGIEPPIIIDTEHGMIKNIVYTQLQNPPTQIRNKPYVNLKKPSLSDKQDKVKHSKETDTIKTTQNQKFNR